MGLSAPKQRVRYGNDPNNNSWANSTSTFGHKFLCAQGWQPGSALGLSQARHAVHYTDASLGQIGFAVRPERAGVGCHKVAATENEKFGLNMFQNLLSRLNGKEEDEIRKEEVKQQEGQLKSFHLRRFGTMVFVSGGFLIGQKVRTVSSPDSTPAASSKKRKREAKDEAEHKTSESDEPEKSDDKNERKRARREEKQQKSEEKKQRKAEKRARKEEKRAKRERKKATERAADGSDDDDDNSSTADTPPMSARPTPAALPATGHFRARQRYIQQKRLAVQDADRMREIFMIKTPA